MTNQQHQFLKGIQSTLAFQTGVIPFGLLYATLATAAGFSWWLVMLFSVVVFAGSSQLVFIDLLSHLGSPLQAVFGANIVNMRHLIYGAALSQELSRRWRIVLAYLLTDQLYAITQTQKTVITKIPAELRQWFYLGSGLSTWFFWQVSSALGIFFGRMIPVKWNLDFAIPLMFMPMLFKVCKNKYSYYTAGFAVVFVGLLHKIPYGLGLMVAILLASLLGTFLEDRNKDKMPSRTES
jgi:4-azaleucine resistance transporter AzlC